MLKETKDIAILSGFVRYRSNNKTFYLHINSRLLGKYLINLEDKIKVDVFRDKEFALRVNNKEGNLLRGDKRGPLTCISKKLIRKEEQEFLKSKDTKYSFPCNLIINPSQFGISKYDLYPDKDAANLASELEKLNIEIPKRIFTSAAFNHDLEFNYKGKDILLEITKTQVSKIRNRNYKHQPSGGNIRAHIFDIYRKCATDKILNENKKIGFVVIPFQWENIKHIQEIINICKLTNCHIIFSNFYIKNWAKLAANKIVKILKNNQ